MALPTPIVSGSRPDAEITGIDRPATGGAPEDQKTAGGDPAV